MHYAHTPARIAMKEIYTVDGYYDYRVLNEWVNDEIHTDIYLLIYVRTHVLLLGFIENWK